MRNMKRGTTNGRIFIVTSGSNHYISIWIDKYVANCCEKYSKISGHFHFSKVGFWSVFGHFYIFVVSFLSKNGRFYRFLWPLAHFLPTFVLKPGSKKH